VDRARSYGLPAEQVDGNDVLAVHAAAEAAVAGMRKGGGPYFLECVTYRIEPHCGIIPDEREPGERESWSERDPIAMLQERLRDEDGVPEKELAAVDTSVQETIGHAVEYALSSPWPDPTAAHNRTWILG
jgi:TPP-dependent pyruvate/acetoin dehydrogenase alpha subunit